MGKDENIKRDSNIEMGSKNVVALRPSPGSIEIESVNDSEVASEGSLTD